jgi:putative sterol carrier protein
MSLESVTEELKQRLTVNNFGHTAKFVLEDEGVIHVDDTEKPATVTNEDKEAEVTLKCTLPTFEAMLNGTQDPNIAFMMGKLKVEGAMGLALKLNALMED